MSWVDLLGIPLLLDILSTISFKLFHRIQLALILRKKITKKASYLPTLKSSRAVNPREEPLSSILDRTFLIPLKKGLSFDVLENTGQVARSLLS